MACVFRSSSPQGLSSRDNSKSSPAAVRKANVLFVPAFLPLFMLIFWRFRVWFTSSPEMAHDAPQPERPVFPSPRLAVAHAVASAGQYPNYASGDMNRQ
jgi:hypothetical protein